TGVVQGLLHGDVVEGRGVAHEAPELAVDQRLLVQVDDRPADLAAKTHVSIFFAETDAGTAVFKTLQHRLPVVADGGDDADAGDDYPAHCSGPQKFSVEVNRPTRRSLAW